ncbi:DUF4282 domain-containing protein [Klebsiella aerogenes]|uniref:DUF4282 domain-containing protein n=1 Tax=Klebsiella aerogenes TaxID=548 RepID=UPI000AACD8A8|nr:DUF4282 domain-containing protein [Klebsiella aerogenes]
MNLLKLDEMITPKILTGLYLFTTFAAVLLLVVSLLSGNVYGAITCAVVALFNRIFFECIIVVFKNNEHLRNSSEYLRYIANTLANTYDKEHIDASKKATNNHQKDADFVDSEQPKPSQDKQ